MSSIVSGNTHSVSNCEKNKKNHQATKISDLWNHKTNRKEKMSVILNDKLIQLAFFGKVPVTSHICDYCSNIKKQTLKSCKYNQLSEIQQVLNSFTFIHFKAYWKNKSNLHWHLLFYSFSVSALQLESGLFFLSENCKYSLVYYRKHNNLHGWVKK